MEFHYDTGVGTINILIVKPKVLITCTMDTKVFETTEAQRVEDQRHAGYVNGLKKAKKNHKQKTSGARKVGVRTGRSLSGVLQNVA